MLTSHGKNLNITCYFNIDTKPSIWCNLGAQNKTKKTRESEVDDVIHAQNTDNTKTLSMNSSTSCINIMNLFGWTTIDILAALNISYCLNQITSHHISLRHTHTHTLTHTNNLYACVLENILRYCKHHVRIRSSAICDTFSYSLIRSIILRWLVNKLNFTLRWTLKLDHCHFHTNNIWQADKIYFVQLCNIDWRSVGIRI